MKKAEAETAVRSLARQWALERKINTATDHPSFSNFKAWLGEKGYAHYLNFRSAVGADEDAERWFDQELKQTWRN